MKNIAIEIFATIGCLIVVAVALFPMSAHALTGYPSGVESAASFATDWYRRLLVGVTGGLPLVAYYLTKALSKRQA